jgi:hypothetical protein
MLNVVRLNVGMPNVVILIVIMRVFLSVGMPRVRG